MSLKKNYGWKWDVICRAKLIVFAYVGYMCTSQFSSILFNMKILERKKNMSKLTSVDIVIMPLISIVFFVFILLIHYSLNFIVLFSQIVNNKIHSIQLYHFDFDFYFLINRSHFNNRYIPYILITLHTSSWVLIIFFVCSNVDQIC